MPKIKITDDRHTVRLGVNGVFFDLPTGTDIDADEGVMSGLRDAGVAFSVEGATEGELNAVSTIASDPPLSGGPKVVAGDNAGEGELATFKVGDVADDKELGDGVTAGSMQSAETGGRQGTDFNQDTGGVSAPTPGSRDTIATSAPTPAARGKAKPATKRRSAK